MAVVVSLFDGISCGYMAMQKAGVEITQYHAFEIDKYAVKASSHNFPMVQHHGNVFNAKFSQYKGADWVIGGSPCTYWSIAQNKNKREKEPDGNGWILFLEYVRAINEIKPRYFIYENNRSMADEIKNAISDKLGVKPVLINSALVSAQNRQRYYWVGKLVNGQYEQVEIPQPNDCGILLKDVLDGVAMRDKSHAVISSVARTTEREYFFKNQGELVACPVCINSKVDGKQPSVQDRVYYSGGKSPAVTSFNTNCIIPIGLLSDKNTQSARVYSPQGKSTTLNAGGGRCRC